MRSHAVNEQDTFIKGWYIDESLCDLVVNYFESNKSLQAAGTLDTGPSDMKKSMDVAVSAEHEAILPYSHALKLCVDEYKKLYPCLDKSISTWSMTEPMNIQKYKPKEGFLEWHTENSNPLSSLRMLVFMTYLNTVDDGGETEWLHQSVKLKPQKGLTVLWPSDWTHMHKGCVSKTQKKYIITGWFSYR